MSNIPTCAVRAVVRDSVGGEPVEGAKISARLSRYEVYQGYVVPHLVQGVTDVNGECILNLWPNQLGAVESNYAITILALGKSLKTFCVVPSAPTAELSEIAELPPYEGLNDGSLIIGQVLAARDAAVAARDVAITRAGEASVSAAGALASQQAAAASVSIALDAANNASTSATIAQAWATQLGTPVGGGLYSARYYAIDAKFWADSIAGGPVASWVDLVGTITYAQARNALNISNVANLAPADLPISTATQNALNQKYNTATAVAALANKADLDGTGKVPASQLPSYVDDVLEFADLASFPNPGEAGKIYIALDSNKTYRWGASVYVEISASPGSTDAVVEGSTNLYFTAQRVRATVLTGLSLAVGTVIAAGDSVLVALGKLQKQISDLVATVAGKSETATTVTKDSGTGAAIIPAGTTAQRPAPAEALLRYSKTLGRWEGCNGTAWGSLGGASGGGNDAVFYESDIVVTSDYSIPVGRNAMAAGPITINAGASVTIPAGSTLTIV